MALAIVVAPTCAVAQTAVPVVVAGGDTAAPEAPTASTPAPTPSPKRTVLIRGRGFGHGRGLGQWGAYGYAKDLGWNYRQMLDHYYGGTVAGHVSARSAIGVRLTALDAKPLVVFQPKGRLYTAPQGQIGFTLPPGLAGAQPALITGDTTSNVGVGPISAGDQAPGGVVAVGASGVGNGEVPVAEGPVAPPILTAGAAAIKVQLVKGGFQISDGPGCAGPWSVRPGLHPVTAVTVTAGPIDPTMGPDDPASMLQICRGDQRLVYRGDLLAVDAKPGQSTVNIVGLDAYLRGVVPREISAAWGDRAPEAVKAQAVAARSYAAAEKRNGFSNTCDTVACQVYNGRGAVTSKKFVSYEDSRTDAAIAATANEIRINPRSGAPIRTEFSASTGGFTAGGEFPAVPDAGDGTEANPNRSWTVKIPASRFETSKTGTLTAVTVSSRDGNGNDGGRVNAVAFTYTGASTSRTGKDIMKAFGLRSSWFDISLVGEGEVPAATNPEVDAATALTGDAGTVVQAAAAVTVPASVGAGAKSKVKKTKVPATVVIVAAGGSGPVETVFNGAPSTTTTLKPAKSRKTRTKAKSKKSTSKQIPVQP